jgi:hypothetical protein
MPAQNDTAKTCFAWDTDEVTQDTLLCHRTGMRRIPAGELPADAFILTYILDAGLG